MCSSDLLFVIRTSGNPFTRRPSRALTATTLTIVAVALLLPVSPLAHVLAFTVPPPAFLTFVATATAVYLLLVEAAKRLVLRRIGRRR